MKQTLFLVLLFITVQTNASCLETVLEDLRHTIQPAPSAEQMECIESNHEVKNSMVVLCADDMNISKEYERYRFYQKVDKALWIEYRSAQNNLDRISLLKRIQINKIDWSTGGFRSKIDQALAPVMQVEFSCRLHVN